MLQKRLIILLSLLILLPTLVIGWMAYRFSFELIRNDRIKVVGHVAASRHEELKRLLVQTHSRVDGLFNELLKQCSVSAVLRQDCAKELLNDFFHNEGAGGAVIINQTGDERFDFGMAAEMPAVPIFQSKQLAWVTPLIDEQYRYYVLIADKQSSPFQLQVAYPVGLLQPMFAPTAELGLSGEIFLADSAGFFISEAKRSEGHGRPISADPMQVCLSGQNEELLDNDYRGTAVIHGFRYVPEIGGGCIMAHIDQAEAFGPIRFLEKRILLAMLLFIALTTAISKVLAGRIVKPIVRLTETALRIRNGDHSIRAEVAGLDEISELANSFNHMTDALADAQHNLEAKVEERTQALRTSQERYMLAERAVDDGIWDWNILTHEYYLSPRWNKILGYGDGELPNVESIFFELIHPDDKVRASAVFRRHLENKERYRAEIRLRHKDGSYRWVLDRGEALRDENGKPVRMIGSITDITERKAAEAELIQYRDHLEEMVALATAEVQAIVKTAVNGVISIDETGSIRVFNPAA